MRKFVFRVLVCLFVVAAIARGQSQNEQSGNEEDSGYSQISIFAKAVQLLRQDYVDENKTSYHDLITAAMKGMLSSLDKKSVFIGGPETDEMTKSTSVPNVAGVGLEMTLRNGSMTIGTAFSMACLPMSGTAVCMSWNRFPFLSIGR